jgi:hypothetical protein
MSTIPDTPRALAEAILAWTDAEISPVDIALRLAATDQKVKIEAMRILREELIPAAAEREADADFARRGRYATKAELRARRVEMKAQDPHLSAADRQRLIGVATETIKAVLIDHPDADEAKFERVLREKLARRGGQ